MAASEAIQIMLYRGIVFFICCLDSSFCHHGIGITDTKLCYDHNICTGIMCLNCTGRTCPATTNDQYIYIIINFGKVNLFLHKTACRMKHICQLQWSLLTFIRSHFNLCKCIWIIIRMELFQKRIFLISGQTFWLCCHTLCSCSLYLFDGFHHIFWIWCIHLSCPPYFSISLLL